MVKASLLIKPHEIHRNAVTPAVHYAIQGLQKMGQLLELVAPASAVHFSEDASVEDWQGVLQLLARARDAGRRWEIPAGPVVEKVKKPPPLYLPEVVVEKEEGVYVGQDLFC